MSDSISRQDAIRLAEQGQIQGFEWQFKKLCELPSTEPKRKKGRWIAYGDIPKTCSCCHEDWDKYVYGDVLWYSDELPNYCPNCGCDIKGEEDDTD